MRKVKEYFIEHIGWLPHAGLGLGLGGVLLISIGTSICYCYNRSHNRRLKRLEKVCRKELEKQRNKKYEERSSEEEDNMFHGIVPPRGGTVTMMTTTVTNMADNKRIILVMAMEIERLLEETNTEPSAVWRAQRQQILPQEVE